MTSSTSTFLALACLVAANACLTATDPEEFIVDPLNRGFDLPDRPVVVFFVDGLRADVLDELVQRGELPRLSRYFFDRAASVRCAVTSVPSVTYANAVTMLTGCWPSTHGVWANASFDRRQLLTRNYEEEREHAAEDDSRATLFEMLSSEVTAGVALPFERGVKITRAKSAGSGGTEFGLQWFMGREEAADRSLSEQVHEIAEDARRIGRWPVLLVIHYPAVDNVGHDEGSDGAAYREAVANLDEAIGDVLEAFEHGEMLEALTLVLTADHGHHSAPQSLALEECLAAALGTPVLVSVENDGDEPYIERWERYSPVRAVVTPSGVRVASVHLRPGESWNERPTLEQILDFRGAADAAALQRVPHALLSSGAIDLVAVRAGEGTVRVYGQRGAAEIRSTRRDPDEPTFTYEVVETADPLGYDTDEELREWTRSAHTSREWLAATAHLRYPDLVPQLVTAFGDARSGDLVLFAAPGWDFSTEEYAGGHGGLEREEMIVPLYLAGPDIQPDVALPAARLVDLVPTLLDLVGVELPQPPRFDGVSLAELLRRSGARTRHAEHP